MPFVMWELRQLYQWVISGWNPMYAGNWVKDFWCELDWNWVFVDIRIEWPGYFISDFGYKLKLKVGIFFKKNPNYFYMTF